jgi:dTDP-4-dehydrorhamnose reductase
MKVLVLGANGMLGSAVFRALLDHEGMSAWGTVRSAAASRRFPSSGSERIVANVDVENNDALVHVFGQLRPELVINCIGLVKQLSTANDPLQAIPINALLPHRLARLCMVANARLIHFSTDCVFSGAKGHYSETDPPDAGDLYGQSKLLGEVRYPNCLTLRTSIIGHEFQSSHGLVEWFLSQGGRCKGYARAIFSGLPTAVVARVIRDIVIPRPDLHGLFHLAAEPISKLDLLTLIARIYSKDIDIVADDALVLDRSLDGSQFTEKANWRAPDWERLVSEMYESRDFWGGSQ